MDKIVYLLAFAVFYANAFEDDSNSHRILNGGIDTNSEYTYTVSLQLLEATPTATRGHRCSGVLITLQNVVTTASCLHNVTVSEEGDWSWTPIPVASFRIFAGANTLTNDTSPERIRTILRFVVHPDFRPVPALVNDVAVITLNQAFLAATVVPLRLPESAGTYSPEDFTICTASGWDVLTLPTSPQLRYATKYIYNHDFCTLRFILEAGGAPNVHPNMVCAVSYDLTTAGCRGDLGNPLVCDGILTGIQIRYGDTNCRVTSQPELYTRISNHTEWIRANSGAAHFTPVMFLVFLLSISQIMKIV